ncbi:unnamed protein product [Cuscuta europaea]|uniref:Uncharacterized protein n=1 Tax=Cuscuta europaea TaxID=41803 RepID=A0A9P0ZNZ9_CUSEU|nr:unnamed protein product [Cuscuta europaea]
MHCSICKLKGHTKKKCKSIPEQLSQAITKRPRGRPRKMNIDDQVSNTNHHSVVAQPSNRGRGGNRQRRGRGIQAVEGRNKVRGSTYVSYLIYLNHFKILFNLKTKYMQIPAGFGIYYNSADGNQYINTMTNPMNVSEVSFPESLSPLSRQNESINASTGATAQLEHEGSVLILWIM